MSSARPTTPDAPHRDGSRDGVTAQPGAGASSPARQVELAWAVGLLFLTVIGGVCLAHNSSPTWLDTLVPSALTSGHRSALTDVTWLRYPSVVVAASVVLAAVAFPRDRVRSLVCLVGPALALATTELVFKPAVGRTLGGGLSYPSGSTAGAAALGVAAVLAVPAAWRRRTVVVAVVYGLWMSLAVMSLQWHYPTDAAAGLAYGCGVMLLLDTAALSGAEALRRRTVLRRQGTG